MTLNLHRACELAISFLGIDPREMKPYVHKKSLIHNRYINPPKCPSTGEQISCDAVARRNATRGRTDRWCARDLETPAQKATSLRSAHVRAQNRQNPPTEEKAENGCFVGERGTRERLERGRRELSGIMQMLHVLLWVAVTTAHKRIMSPEDLCA